VCFLSFSGLRHARVQFKDEDDTIGDGEQRAADFGGDMEGISMFTNHIKVRDMCDASPLCFDPVTKHPVRMASGSSTWQADSRGADGRLWHIGVSTHG
jgi:hypothetical protein